MNQTLGEKLRFLREKHQYTQEQVSACMHIQRSAYANYEMNKRIPSYHFLVELADFYRISVEYLVRDNITGDFTGESLSGSSEEDRLLLAFKKLEPHFRKEMMEYMRYRLKKQGAGKSPQPRHI